VSLILPVAANRSGGTADYWARVRGGTTFGHCSSAECGQQFGDADSLLSQIPFVGQLFTAPAGDVTSGQALQELAQLQATQQVNYMPYILAGGGILVVILLLKK
jgi:hypothetical protein